MCFIPQLHFPDLSVLVCVLGRVCLAGWLVGYLFVCLFVFVRGFWYLILWSWLCKFSLFLKQKQIEILYLQIPLMQIVLLFIKVCLKFFVPYTREHGNLQNKLINYFLNPNALLQSLCFLWTNISFCPKIYLKNKSYFSHALRESYYTLHQCIFDTHYNSLHSQGNCFDIKD